jgi:hypothetical protein
MDSRSVYSIKLIIKHISISTQICLKQSLFQNQVYFIIMSTVQLQFIWVSSWVSSHYNGHTSSYGSLLLLGGDEHNIYINTNDECYEGWFALRHTPLGGGGGGGISRGFFSGKHMSTE